MSDSLPPCPACGSVYSYEMGALLVCPECAHEWSSEPSATEQDDFGVGESGPIVDSVGNELADGDTVTIVKQLKIKGASGALKVGTKVRNIRLVQGVGDHDIDCKIEGFGQLQLKSSVVRKVL